MKRESALKSAFLLEMKQQLPSFVVIRHEDVRTSGTPDMSITGLGRTSWYEFKHCNPKCSGSGIQELTCLRLAAAGFCRYVIYWEQGLFKRTLVVHPRQLKSLEPEASCEGFSHKFIVEYVQGVHSAIQSSLR